MNVRIPRFLLPPLLSVHDWAMTRPYFDIGPVDDRYMRRGWVLGYHSAARNEGNPHWHGRTLGRLHAVITERLAARAHTILRSDHARALHCHPVAAVSVVLETGYWEVQEATWWATAVQPEAYRLILDGLVLANPTADRRAHYARFGIFWRAPGDVVFRRAAQPHRIVLLEGTSAKTLWLMGPKVRSWGFYPEGKFVPWREYLNKDA